MSLLRQIQDAAVDKNTDLPTLLRQCKVLAARLGNEPFKRWVESELNGYSKAEDLPDYRVLTVNSYGDFSGPFGSSLRGAPIPLGCIPKEFRENFRHSYLTGPISGYVSLIEGKDDTNPHEPWPADVTARFGSKVYRDMTCLAAWKVIPRNALVALLDTVRNRVLSFALEIEGEAPDAGEAPVNSQPVPQERVTQIFNTYITGNVQNVATGSSNFSQISKIKITHSDFSSLADHLREEGVEESDLKELQQALADDGAEAERKPFGKRATAWMGKMIGKAASGTWKVSIDVASNVLAKALSQYYGLEE
jgi:hypothetical protein